MTNIIDLEINEDLGSFIAGETVGRFEDVFTSDVDIIRLTQDLVSNTTLGFFPEILVLPRIGQIGFDANADRFDVSSLNVLADDVVFGTSTVIGSITFATNDGSLETVSYLVQAPGLGPLVELTADNFIFTGEINVSSLPVFGDNDRGENFIINDDLATSFTIVDFDTSSDRIDLSELNIHRLDQLTVELLNGSTEEYLITLPVNADGIVETIDVTTTGGQLTVDDFILAETIEVSGSDEVTAVDGEVDIFVFVPEDGVSSNDFRATINNFNPNEDFIDLSLVADQFFTGAAFANANIGDATITDFSEHVEVGFAVTVDFIGEDAGFGYAIVYSDDGPVTSDNIFF